MAETRDRELVISPGTYAYVLDGTKGHVSTYAGPHKSSLSATDELVTYNPVTLRFDIVPNQGGAIKNNVMCPMGFYVVLENPARDKHQPEPGKVDVLPLNALQFGRIENLPGPQFFPLWPGQVATVIQGHHLHKNQYLMVRIADDEAAKSNWDKSVVRSAADLGGAQEPAKSAETSDTPRKPQTASRSVLGIDANTLVTGQLIVVKGTDVAFYIPPTGVEVLKDESGQYIRDAITLERLEYSILLDQDGNREYKIGPDVVFPSPTQEFHSRMVTDAVTNRQVQQRKFRAIELQPTNGIYIKVIADYEENGEQYKAGQELFITGREVAIYYPREEHAIMTYGGNDKTYAVAIPAGEGRYVLDRQSGAIHLVTGPDMYLPNPITSVIVRRILTDKECQLYYPGNSEVLNFNRSLAQNGVDAASDPVVMSAAIARNFSPARRELDEGYSASVGNSISSGGLAANRLTRSTTYTPPRMITLNTKFDGAIRIDVWSGHAVQVVNSKGERRTVIGPQTVLLEYDEYLERLSLSTGKPKTDNKRIDTPYLRYISNPVSDIISLKTQDLVDVNVQVKYLIRFEQIEQDQWFAMDNYVQYMVDHLRSMIGNAVRTISVQDFYVNATNILRDVILGKKDEKGDRALKHFSENGMTVYDLELITVEVCDDAIAELLARSRQDHLIEAVALERSAAKSMYVAGIELATRDQARSRAITAEFVAVLDKEQQERQAELTLANIQQTLQQETERGRIEQARAQAKRNFESLLLEITRSQRDLEQVYLEATAERQIRVDTEAAAAHKVRMEALAPALIEAFVGMAQTGQLENIAEHLAPLALVRGESLVGTLQQLVKGTPIEKMLENVQGLSAVAKR
jgi:major vault protein